MPDNKSNENSTSLNKYISETGVCSRREADRWIEDGRVTINDNPTKKGNRVFDGDIVKVDDKPLKAKPKSIYLAFNKPVGIICTADLDEPKNIISYINHPQRIVHVGRLDKPSEGLILLTNDGDIVNKILRARYEHEKEYVVTVNKPISHRFIRKMSDGVPILDTITKKCSVWQTSDTTFKIILTQGLNRQIRRMCEYFDYEVTKLKRVRIMNIRLNKLPIGEWRELTNEERTALFKMVKNNKD